MATVIGYGFAAIVLWRIYADHFSQPDADPDGPPAAAIEGAELSASIDLIDCAIATSSPTGTVFDESGTFHHLFDPATGRPVADALSPSVIAKSAAVADAVSTAGAIMSEERLASLDNRSPELDVIVARRGWRHPPESKACSNGPSEPV